MRRIVFFVIALLLLHTIAVGALSAGEAKTGWLEAKKVSREKQEIHRDAKIEFAADKSEENRQAVVDTGKEVLHAALDEAEAWLNWKDLEAKESPHIPEDLKEAISRDVETNLAKVDELRTDVDGVTNRLELGIVFLKMVGKYMELLTDVARNSGKMWVHIGNTHLDTAEDYESKLRLEAEKIEDNLAITEKLDVAKEYLNEARSNIDKAETSYEKVMLPGTPLINFAQGNDYMRVAKTNLLGAHRNMNNAYSLMLRGG